MLLKHISRDIQGVLWKALSTTCFAIISMVACGLQCHQTQLSPSQVAFFQVCIPFVGLMLYKLWAQEPSSLLTKKPLWALVRSGSASIAFLGWFCALRIYPLSIAISFRLLAPLLTFVVALIFLQERTTRSRLIGLFILLIGAPVLIRQEVWHTTIHHKAEMLQLIMLPIMVVVGYVCANLAGKKLLKSVNPAEATFSLLGLNSLFIGIVAVFMWHPPRLQEWPWLIGIGLLEWVAQWSLARALSLTDLNMLAPLSLWRFGISALFGVLFLGEHVSWMFMMGITLMICATPLIVRRAPLATHTKRGATSSI